MAKADTTHEQRNNTGEGERTPQPRPGSGAPPLHNPLRLSLPLSPSLTSNSVSFLHCSAVEPCTLPEVVKGVWKVNRRAPSPASNTSTTFIAVVSVSFVFFWRRSKNAPQTIPSQKRNRRRRRAGGGNKQLSSVSLLYCCMWQRSKQRKKAKIDGPCVGTRQNRGTDKRASQSNATPHDETEFHPRQNEERIKRRTGALQRCRAASAPAHPSSSYTDGTTYDSAKMQEEHNIFHARYPRNRLAVTTPLVHALARQLVRAEKETP